MSSLLNSGKFNSNMGIVVLKSVSCLGSVSRPLNRETRSRLRSKKSSHRMEVWDKSKPWMLFIPAHEVSHWRSESTSSSTLEWCINQISSWGEVYLLSQASKEEFTISQPITIWFSIEQNPELPGFKVKLLSINAGYERESDPCLRLNSILIHQNELEVLPSTVMACNNNNQV